MKFLLRTHHDDGAAGVVHALAQQVLAEAALLALEGVGKGLQGPVVGAPQHTPAAAIVKQGVYRLLEHALFVAHDDVGSMQLHQLLQPVVAIDDAAIEVVEIGSGEAAAIERHQGAQLGRNHRYHVQNHPLRLVAGLAESFQDLQTLGVLHPFLLGGVGLHLFPQLLRQRLNIHGLQEFLDGFGAHGSAEFTREFRLQLAITLFRKHFPLVETGLARIHDNILLEIQDGFQIAQRDIEQVADAAGQSLKEPDVGAGSSQFDVSHALAPHLGKGHLDTALVADNSAVFHALVFSTKAFPVGHRAKDLGAEKSVALRLEGPIVNGFRLGHFAVGPGADLFGRSQADANGVKLTDQTNSIIRAASKQCCLLCRLETRKSKFEIRKSKFEGRDSPSGMG